MTGSLVLGDHVSCSRVGGAMRRESSRLSLHAQSLADAVEKLAAAQSASPAPVASPTMPTNADSPSFVTVMLSVRALRAAADALDEAGAALQRYATELAEGHELARAAQRRVDGAGLLLDGTRVLEPWGPASAQEAEDRRARLPGVQARVDLATAHVGRARARLRRELTRLAASFPTHSPETPAARQPRSPVRATRST